ncbi:MAG TPA: hypothetical protein VGG09_01080 [Acidimicrobiales bacterium]
MTRHRQTLIVLTAAAALTIVLDLASAREASAHTKTNAPSAHVIVLRGNGIGRAVFGQTETAAAANLRAALGSPSSPRPVSMAGNCTIDAALEWSTMSAYFFHGHFVGYATGSMLEGPGEVKVPDVTTAAGLRIGDTLAAAARLYRGSWRTSYAQGGSWFAKTSTGTFSGYLTSEVNSTKPVPRIADITAGSVGCPAASP